MRSWWRLIRVYARDSDIYRRFLPLTLASMFAATAVFGLAGWLLGLAGVPGLDERGGWAAAAVIGGIMMGIACLAPLVMSLPQRSRQARQRASRLRHR